MYVSLVRVKVGLVGMMLELGTHLQTCNHSYCEKATLLSSWDPKTGISTKNSASNLLMVIKKKILVSYFVFKTNKRFHDDNIP